MSRFEFLATLAASLFIAPTPALVALGYLNGGTIPITLGIAAMVVSCALFWLVVLSVRRRRAARRRAEMEAADTIDVDILGTSPGVSARPQPRTAPAAPSETRNALVLRDPVPETGDAYERSLVRKGRDRMHDVRSYEDLPDPFAETRNLKPAEVLIDRVSDITQIKRLVAANRVHLMTAWHRQVRETATGDRTYGDWAVEADRLLLSASFMTRTMTRHEAIALVTAEVAALIYDRGAEQGAGAVSADGRGTQAPAHATADPGYGATAPSPETAGTGGYGAPDRMAGAQPAEAFRALGQPGSAGDAHQGASVVPMASSVSLRRSAAILECAGWRTNSNPEARAGGIDLLASRGGRIVGLACAAADAPATAEAVRRAAQPGALFGTDLVAIVSAGSFDHACRVAATHAGVVLMQESDLEDLDAFLPGGGAPRYDGSVTTAAE